MDEPKDIFGRSDPRIIWTDVPQEQYDKIMAMPEDKRNKILSRIDDGVFLKRSPVGWKKDYPNKYENQI